MALTNKHILVFKEGQVFELKEGSVKIEIGSITCSGDQVDVLSKVTGLKIKMGDRKIKGFVIDVFK